MAIPLNITNGFYVSKSLPLSHQRCVNLYVNISEQPSLSQEQLFGTPGISLIATTGEILQRNRGAHVKGGIPYFVNGDSLYSLDRSVVNKQEVFTTTNLGSVEGEGRVSMADNGKQLMILVPGAKGYIYDESAGTPFQEITDTDFTANGAPQIVVYVDGYFLVTTDSKKFIISSINDGLSWNALDFGSAESDPDNIVAPVVANNQVYITGSETTEGYQDVGGGGFPFQRNNVFLDKGCKAPFSIVKSNSTFFMIGAGEDESPAVWQYTGNSFRKVSSDAIDIAISKYSDEQLQESFAMSYAQDGAYFITFSFPDKTFSYDLISKKWHERESVIDEEIKRWRVNSLITAYGRILVGDSKDGRIGELSLNQYKEYDTNIVRIFTTQPFANQGNEITSTMLELTMESGVGDADTPDPKVSMSLSKDGKTFGPERIRGIGRIGEYGRRVIWRKNGRFPRFAVLLFRLSDPVKPVFVKLEVDL